jgi:putative transposase
LVWIPKYRKRILIGKIAARLKQLLHQACNVNRWMLSEMSVNEYHVHILVQISPRESVTEVVKILKGGTSKIINQSFRNWKSSSGEIACGPTAILPKP